AGLRALWPLLLASLGDHRAARAIEEARRLGVGAIRMNRSLIGYAEAVLAGRAGQRQRAHALAGGGAPWLHDRGARGGRGGWVRLGGRRGRGGGEGATGFAGWPGRRQDLIAGTCPAWPSAAANCSRGRSPIPGWRRESPPGRRTCCASSPTGWPTRRSQRGC